MLVLGRKSNERIVIGDDITITVTEVGGTYALILVDAPKEFLVHRGEDVEKNNEYVYSRRLAQQICIGNDITITVAGIRGDKVRLGIDAPRDIPVHRSEIADMIKNKKGI